MKQIPTPCPKCGSLARTVHQQHLIRCKQCGDVRPLAAAKAKPLSNEEQRSSRSRWVGTVKAKGH
jgi:uncharacterized Zn finger protein